jgi:hypothetical protein
VDCGNNQASTAGDNQASTAEDNQVSTAGDNQASTAEDIQASTGVESQASTAGDSQTSSGGNASFPFQPSVCESNNVSCSNHGTCIDGTGESGYRCACGGNYFGADCSMDMTLYAAPGDHMFIDVKSGSSCSSDVVIVRNVMDIQVDGGNSTEEFTQEKAELVSHGSFTNTTADVEFLQFAEWITEDPSDVIQVSVQFNTTSEYDIAMVPSASWIYFIDADGETINLQDSGLRARLSVADFFTSLSNSTWSDDITQLPRGMNGNASHCNGDSMAFWSGALSTVAGAEHAESVMMDIVVFTQLAGSMDSSSFSSATRNVQMHPELVDNHTVSHDGRRAYSHRVIFIRKAWFSGNHADMEDDESRVPVILIIILVVCLGGGLAGGIGFVFRKHLMNSQFCRRARLMRYHESRMQQENHAVVV